MEFAAGESGRNIRQLLPFLIKVVCMEMAAAIGVTVGFALLRSAVRRAARRSGRKRE
jgi:hypothetical protein